MNPAKRKWLARLEAAKKVAEVTVTEAAPVLKVEEKIVAEPVVEAAEIVVEPAATAEPVTEITPVASSKKKK